MKKKVLAVILASAILAGALCGCSRSKSDSEGKQQNVATDGSKLSVVCTIYPEYDWVRQILGDRMEAANVTLLLDNGVDLHSYQPTAEDIVTISNADLFIYVGGESDAWVDEVLASRQNQNMIVLDLMDVLADAVKQEEVAEGMQPEDEQGEGEDASEQDKQEEIEYDEHVWLSLKNAATICRSISDALGNLDAEHANAYQKNCEAYTAKLSALDDEYEQTVNTASRTTILFGDRFPFRYLVDDYHLKYYAAFVGCSAETEASFETVTFLARKVDELALPVVLVIESSDQKIAQTIINNTKAKNQKILTMDSMQSVTMKEIDAGASYLAIMEKNLDVLKEALIG